MNGHYFDSMGGSQFLGSHGGFGFQIAGGVISLVLTALLIAATIIAIILLIKAARNRGIEVKGGRLAAFWFIGICLTPIMLALYVLALKPQPQYATVEAQAAPMGFVPVSVPAEPQPVAPMPQEPLAADPYAPIVAPTEPLPVVATEEAPANDESAASENQASN